MDLLDLIEQRRFLGGEFLTWLWFSCDTDGGDFELPEMGNVGVSFDDQLVLESFLAESEQSRLSGASPIHSPEAKTALKAGKRISKAKLRILKDDREWVFVVSAPDFTFSSVKVPAVLKEEDERLLERVSLVDELSEIWIGLYRKFLGLRLSDQWKNLEEAFGAWSAEG